MLLYSVIALYQQHSPGQRFDKVILQKVKVSAVIAVHTDSYSSREWCRREIIEAKRRNVPLVVANCIHDRDERSFPYMGNVPVVRMDPDAADRIDVIVSRLLDEVLKDFLWRCRVQLARDTAGKGVAFLPRPPELISLVGLPKRSNTALRAGQPLFLLGGFDGCARDIAEDLGLAPAGPTTRPPWPGRGDFTGFTTENLNNGLDAEENAILATTVHVDQAVTLLLRGLLRGKGGSTSVEAGE